MCFRCSALVATIGLLFGSTAAPGQAPIYASAQLLDANGVRFNQVFSVSPTTGLLTPVTPDIFPDNYPAGLGMTPSGDLLGFRGAQLTQVELPSGAFTPIGGPGGASPTGFDVLSDGRAFAVVGNERRLRSVDLVTGAATPFGPTDAITDVTGGASAFIIGLGSIGTDVFGVDVTTRSLVRFAADTGVASVVGSVGAVISGTLADGTARSRYSGFASMTGYDANGDGQFDTLLGGVNFFDDDNDPGTPAVRFGGVAQFNLTDGTWELIGQNPGYIFFGMGSVAVPEPASLSLVALAAGVVSVRRFRRRSVV